MLVSSLVLVMAAVVKPGDVAFIADVSAPLRQAPTPNAGIIDVLPLWTPVRVDNVEGAFARVVVGPRAFLFESPGGEARPGTPDVWSPHWPRGAVPLAALDVQPPSRKQVLALADAASSPKLEQAFVARAWALDPHDMEVALRAKQIPSVRRGRDAPFAQADLVFGCRGDVTRAAAHGGTLATWGHSMRMSPLPKDACLARVDLRPACPVGDELEPDAAGEERSKPERAQRPPDDAHRRALARLLPLFSQHGPALRLTATAESSARPVLVRGYLLVADGCVDCSPAASASDRWTERLRVPLLERGQTALLHVPVPRYTGALYDVVFADGPVDDDSDDDDGLTLELAADFDVDPREDPGPGHHLFSAPEACGCSCD